MIPRRAFIHTAAALAVVPAQAATSPVLVELFTSQGCSSCPPADAVLAALARRADVVALAFHVDYWDHIGWKDPYASPAHTARQRQYRKVFGNRSVYTPQMVFNGVIEFPGQTEPEALRAVAASGSGGAASPRIILRRSRNDDIGVEIDEGPVAPGASVFGAVYGAPGTTKVRRGENAGRALTNVNMVRALETLSPYSGAKIALDWRPDLTDAAGVAVWIQPKDLGPVIAAAQLPLTSAL
jgi:hypothetical protein